jgi:Tfp pilus assembly protein PilP
MKAYAFRWVTLLFLVFAGVQLWLSRPFWEPPAGLPNVEGTPGGGSQPASKPLDPQTETQSATSSVLFERPLFEPNRRPFVPSSLPVTEEPPQPVEEPQPESPPEQLSTYADPSQLRLMGVLMTGNEQAALIATPEKPEGSWTVQGGDVSGWRVQEIAPNSVTLQVDGQTHVLQHYQQGNP